MRTLLLVATSAALACAAPADIWPDQFGPFQRASNAPVTVEDRPVWDDYGLDQAERAEYASGAQKFTGTAYRLKDPTAAFAAFEWLRPADARPSVLTAAAADLDNGVLLVFGNYLIRFDGWKPEAAAITPLLLRLPHLDQSPLPIAYLPPQGLVKNSERYVLGPASLERFEKGVPPSVAAFSMDAEAQIGRYETPGGPMQLAVFSYPNMQIARQRLEAFQNLPGALAKRSGPLVAVILSPGNADAAEALLAAVRYKATLTTNERVPTRRDNVGDMMVNIFILVGVILALIIPAGLLVGTLRRFGWGTTGDPMTMLHLEDRSQKG